MARGLARAHALGFVHRDLKPQNVFLTATGAKILDFGLARPASGPATEDEETASAYTAAGSVMGTAGYMAPEQLRGAPIPIVGIASCCVTSAATPSGIASRTIESSRPNPSKGTCRRALNLQINPAAATSC